MECRAERIPKDASVSFVAFGHSGSARQPRFPHMSLIYLMKAHRQEKPSLSFLRKLACYSHERILGPNESERPPAEETVGFRGGRSILIDMTRRDPEWSVRTVHSNSDEELHHMAFRMGFGSRYHFDQTTVNQLVHFPFSTNKSFMKNELDFIFDL